MNRHRSGKTFSPGRAGNGTKAGGAWTRSRSGIPAFGRHGAYPGEQDAAQPFDVDLVLQVDLSASSRSDLLTDTVHYAVLYARLVEIVEGTSFSLLERLAAELRGAVPDDPRIHTAELSVAKPQLLDGATARVTLRRQRTGG